MSVLYVRARDNVVPANFTVDFNDIVDTPGPFFVGITAWVSTADAAAGVLQFGVQYADPTSSTRDVTFNVSPQLILSDPTSFFATDIVVLQRLANHSLWNFVSSLVAGIAGTSRISYRIINSSAAAPDLQAW
jgi:hypothetical protein